MKRVVLAIEDHYCQFALAHELTLVAFNRPLLKLECS